MTISSTNESRAGELEVSVSGIKHRFSCQVHSIEAGKLTASVAARVVQGSIVSAQIDDTLVMGEVVRAYPQTSGHWQVEVKIAHVLNGLQSLMNLRAHLLGSSYPVRAEAAKFEFAV